MALKENVVNDGWSTVTNKAVYGIDSAQGPFYAVKSEDLDALKDAIERWSEFLRHVFLSSTQGYISREVLAQIALEDTELYLDVKIQLSQCMVSVDDDALASRLEKYCNAIRKSSYNFIAVTLPKLSDNSRQLVEIKHNTALLKTQSDKTLFIDSNANNSGSGFDFQEGLSVNRQRVMFQVQKQHREVIRQLHHLNKRISSALVSDQYEL